MRRLALSAAAAIVLATSLSGTATANGSFLFSIDANSCSVTGGQWGDGRLVLKVTVQETGKSGATKLEILSKVQKKHGTTWDQYLGSWPPQWSAPFPDDASSHSLSARRGYDFSGNEIFHQFRIWVQMRVWSNTNGVLAEHTVRSVSCS